MDAWQARHGLTSAAFQTAFDALASTGYRLVDVSGYSDGSGARYTGLWIRRSGPVWQARHGLSATRYQAAFDEMRQAGYRLRRVSGYATAAGTRFAAIWDKAASVPWEARHGLTAAAFQAEFDGLAQRGYRLVDISGYQEGGSRYAAIWEKSAGPPWQARHGLTGAQYQAAFEQLAAQGYVLVKVSGHTAGNAPRYSAIWVQRSSIGWAGRHGVDGDDYQRAFDELFYQGYQLQQVCGFATANGPRFAAVWESQHFSHGNLATAENLATRFMRRFSVPGLSVAISYRGRLVYARAFGLADRGANIPLSVHHRMRIASISKPITAGAIMLLVQQRRLALTRRVFGRRAVLGTTFGTLAYDANERAITVERLLNHSAGFRNNPNDPMFTELTRNHASLIGWVLDNRAPASVPGAAYDYSNFGYCVLGRIIERVTGTGYANHLQSALLGPAGAASMRIAGDTLAARAPNEVVYDGQSGETPYTMRVARMDAHGGWIATAIDLLRFLRVVDGFMPPADFLTAANVTRMTTGSAARNTYALGWAVDGNGNWDHNGALPGTLSMLRRRRNQLGQAALVNTRRPNTATSNAQDVMMAAMYQVVDDMTAQLGAMPTYDLFS